MTNKTLKTKEMTEDAQNEEFAEANIQELQNDLEESSDALSDVSSEESEDSLDVFEAFDAGEITLDEAEVLFDEMGMWSKLKGNKRFYEIFNRRRPISFYTKPVPRYSHEIRQRLRRKFSNKRKNLRKILLRYKLKNRANTLKHRFRSFEVEGYSADASSYGLGNTQFGQGNVQSQQGWSIAMIPVIVPSSCDGLPVPSVQPRLQ